MVKHLDVAILFFIFSLTSALSAQSVKNSFDSEGKRHGAWRKNFDKTNQPRYEGEFDHGKEIGLFKFYTLNKGKSVLSATKQFNKENDNAEVKFFSSSGKLISEGQMDGKLYIGQWTFYHNKSSAVMSKETYNNSGQLEGEKTVYYPSGQIAETSHYHNGKLNGQTLTYSENGQLLNDFQYEDNELQGQLNTMMQTVI
ncbi:toxin-antitoxin system YwqK family antitoxin [Sediminibacter sp. Hel_I_10]|uniref:toxin-antitoxin system YwqK family antitoxin n=1 Tax=Sediminibacter sp. Hel_I_10 TaxID=1392490 RepID=UPI001E40C28A|nr:toxin-antitoxin system YwqK family antitoxin [Sediminibacter sp. Hel_I_10]